MSSHHDHQISINFMNLNGSDNHEIFHGFALQSTAYIVSPPLMARTVSLPQVVQRRRKGSDDVVVERKQKRLIKNRESATRSRARKLAYTNELENKISRLEEEIKRLRQQKDRELEEQCEPKPEPKYQLRRSNSAPLL